MWPNAATVCAMTVWLASACGVAAAADATAPQAPSPSLSVADAQRTFARARRLCTADGGRLWGVSLCVPMMLVDADRAAIANEPLPGATRDGSVFRFVLPPGEIVSSAPLSYAGREWAELSWPLYGPAQTQAVTLMHESFHVVQPKLGFRDGDGFAGVDGDPSLDTRAGRVWFRGELGALRGALRSVGSARRSALADALAMRAYRHRLFPSSAEEDREQDVIEGLAEGTGIDAGLPPNERVGYALFDMSYVEEQPSFARAFAYATGPAYCELLDAVARRWRRGVTAASDVASLAGRAYGLAVATPSAANAEKIVARYGGLTIESEEAARAARRAAQAVIWRRDLVAGSTLSLPLGRVKLRFNPRDVENFNPYGSVYHSLTVVAAWGTLTVDGGDALVPATFDTASVAAPRDIAGSALRGNGWTLTLANGYRIAPNPKKRGCYVVVPR